MNGILNLLKPPGISSNNIIGAVKKISGIKKIGHTGTLDPAAAGVLPLCLGKATKVASFLLMDKKTYWCEVILGTRTDTDDTCGRVLEKKRVEVPTDRIILALESFKGKIEQVPPRFSSVKISGKPAYKLSRKNEPFTIKARQVEIFSLDIVNIEKNIVRFMVHCSRGTYMRSIARDLGHLLGTGGCLNFLIRTRSGPFKLEDTYSLEEIKSCEIKTCILPADQALEHLPAISLIRNSVKKVKTGLMINLAETDLTTVAQENAIYRLYSTEGHFLALCTFKEGRFHPFKVFIQ